MKRILLFLLILMVLLSACSSSADVSDVTNVDVSTLYKKRPINEEWPDLLIEEKYDQIELRPYAEVFSSDCESISCYVVNHHTGYAFYMYRSAYLEKKSGNEWVFVPMKSGYDMTVAESWSLCAPVKTEMRDYGLSATCYIRDLRDGKIEAGEYRMIIGIGQDIYFMPFTVK